MVDELLALSRPILDAPVAPRADLQRRYVGRVLNRVAMALTTGDVLAGQFTLVGGADLAKRAAALRDRLIAAALTGPGLRVVPG